VTDNVDAYSIEKSQWKGEGKVDGAEEHTPRSVVTLLSELVERRRGDTAVQRREKVIVREKAGKRQGRKRERATYALQNSRSSCFSLPLNSSAASLTESRSAKSKFNHTALPSLPFAFAS
jgi:hypothetical protein